MFSDNFTRDDSSSLGTHWTEVAGDWEISSNRLIVASAGAVVICDTEQDVPFVVEATCSPEQDAAPRVIVDYTDDDNYLFVEVEWTAESKSIFLYRRSGGDDTMLAYRGHVADDAETFTIRVCVEYDDEEEEYRVKGMIVGLAGTLVSTTASSIDTTVGLGSGTADEPRFTLFDLKLHADEDATCPECGTPDCYVATDDFGDTTSITDLGSGWTETAGDSSIAAGELVLPSGASISPTFSRALPFVMEIAAEIDDGEMLKVLVDYTDASNHHRVELEYDGTDIILRLYARAGGTDTLKSSMTLPLFYGSSVILWVCVTDSSVGAKAYADVSGPTKYFAVADQEATPASTAVVIEAAGGQIELTSWGWQKHREENESCPVCAHCLNCSDPGNPPRVFEIVISGLSYRDAFRCADCEDLNGTYYAEYYGFDTDTGYIPECWWVAPTGVASARCPSEWVLTIFKSGTHYYLRVVGDWGSIALDWRKDLGTDVPDCNSLQNLVIPPLNVDSCYGTANSVVVSVV